MKLVQAIQYKLQVKMSQAYGKARELYYELIKEYLENRMHPNHLELLKAGKITFRDDSFIISDPGSFNICR